MILISNLVLNFLCMQNANYVIYIGSPTKK